MKPERTAVARQKPSFPVRLLLQEGYLHGKILDYGGGKGADFRWLKSLVDIQFFDPFYLWDGEKIVSKKNIYNNDQEFDTVICTYVLNVLLKDERQQVISHIQSILTEDGKAYITVRADDFQIHGTPFEDGVRTIKDTFQKSFSKNEVMREFPGATIIAKTRFSITFFVVKRQKPVTCVTSCEIRNLSHMNL